MNLTLGTGQVIESPTESQIEVALRSLSGGPDSFAILGSGDQHYIQTSGSSSEAFVLEYRDGSDPEHYQCTNTALMLEQVLAAFLSYRRGESEFKRTLDWEREVEASRPAWIARLVIASAAILAALALWRVLA